MGLVNLNEVLEDARRGKYAVGAFNVFNIETLNGVVEAAIENKSPVVLGIYEGHFSSWVDIELFSPVIQRVAERAPVPITLHLDHAQTVDSIVKAIKCGFTSVMFDGFNLSYEEKVEQTREVVRIAHSVGCTVEAELGHVARVGDRSVHTAGVLADPDVAADFVEKTGVDVLAVSIGTVHGMTEQSAILQIDRLIQIRERVDCYLSLHGGSGVSDEGFRRAIENGINKIAVYTRLSMEAVERLKRALAADSVMLPELMREVQGSFKDSVREKLKVFGSAGVCLSRNSMCSSCSSCGVAPSYEASKQPVSSADLVRLIGEAIVQAILEKR